MNTNTQVAEAVAQAIPTLTLSTVKVPVQYNFKSVTVLDENEKPKLDDKGKELKTKRDAFSTTIPVPTLESLFPGADLPKQDIKDKDGKVIGSEYVHPEHRALFEMLEDSIKAVGKELVDETKDNSQINFPDAMFDFGALSRKPKYERKGGGLQKELLESLCESYSKAMVALGKPEKGIKIACHYFMRRCKGLDAVRQEIVQKMQANLGTWFTGISEEEQGNFATAYQLLDGRISEALGNNLDEVM